MASEQRLDQLAADYIAGNLSPENAVEFAQLVDSNSEFRATVNRLEKSVELMINELPLEEPPARLKESILAAVDALATDVPVTDLSNIQSSRRRLSFLTVGLGTLAAVTTLLSLVLGVNNYRLRLAGQQLEQLQLDNQLLKEQIAAALPAQEAQLILRQPSTQFYDFEGTDKAVEVSGNMIVDRDNLRAAIAFQNLDPLPETQTYALWVVRQGEYIPCGEFQTDADGTIFATLPMPPVYQSRPWVKDVIVTIESTTIPNQPSGPIVAQTI